MKQRSYADYKKELQENLDERHRQREEKRERDLRRSHRVWAVWMVLFCIGAALSLGRGLIVDPATAIHAAEVSGYSDVKVTERDWFLVGFAGCDSGDAAGFHLSATNPAGQHVDDVIACSGWPFKGMTLRVKP